MGKRAIVLFFLLIGTVSGQVDYPSQIQTIFTARCISCHGATSGVTLTDYAATLASVGNQYGKPIVAPGDTAESPLWDKINPNPEKGNRMPPSGPLSAGDIQTIGLWIAEGANETPTRTGNHPALHPNFAISDNYPNPFNPSTQIRFVLRRESIVELSVRDVNGRLVRKVRNHYTAGTHEFRVDLPNEPSGIYLAQMTASFENRNVESRMLRIILLR